MSKPFETELENGDVFLGTANRFVKLGFLTINVYAFGLYVDGAGAKEALQEYAGREFESLAKDETFYHAFVAGKFRKTFVLKMCRTLPRAKMVASFTKSLLSRVDVDEHTQAKKVIEKLVPSEFKEDDQVKLEMDSDGETITGYVRGEQVFQVKSPGQNGIWSAFQNIFYDMNTEVLEIKRDSIEGFEDLLRVKKEQVADVESKQRLTKLVTQQTHPTWKIASGRENGSEGYQIGDLTRMVLRRIFFGGSDPAQDAQRGLELEELKKKNKELEGTVFKLEQALQDSKEQVTRALGQVCLLGAFEMCCICVIALFTLPSQVLENAAVVLWVSLALCVLEVLKGPESTLPVWGLIGEFHRHLLRPSKPKTAAIH